MSPDGTPDPGGSPAVETEILPRQSDIGGFKVRRVLPSARRRMVGPFIFVDQMGPVDLAPGHGLDVAPHPHIGLATVTYLFDGEIVHRDSLGSRQPIRPGDVNWMTAGRGIVHSERTGPEPRKAGQRMYGLQTWVALPHRDEEIDPAFAHHPAADLPAIEGEGKSVRLVAGALFGAVSPVATRSELFYAAADLAPGAALPLDPDHEERAAYLVEGAVEVDGVRYEPGRLLAFAPGAALTLKAVEPARLMLLGGAAMDGPRHIYWNFVSSSRERIEQAKEDWRQRRFAPVPDDDGYVPLPE